MGQDFRTSDLKDISVHTVELGGELKGFVYVSKRNVSHIFIEESLSPECTAETLAHETYHLKYDTLSHGIGLNRQHELSEHKANRFAIKNMKKILEIMTN